MKSYKYVVIDETDHACNSFATKAEAKSYVAGRVGPLTIRKEADYSKMNSSELRQEARRRQRR